MWWLLYTTLTIHTYICIFIYIRMRWIYIYNSSCPCLFGLCLLFAFWLIFLLRIRPSVPELVFRLYVCSFFFGWVCYCFQIRNPSGTCLALLFFVFEETPRRRRCHCAVVCPRPHRTLTHRSFDILIFCFFVLISVWKAVLTLTSFTKITPEPMSTTTFDHCEHSPMSPTDRRAEKK